MGISNPKIIHLSDEDAAKEKCRNQKNATALRVCMRQQLRMMNPATRRMGAVVERQRGQ
jgi:hypothetical protein